MSRIIFTFTGSAARKMLTHQGQGWNPYLTSVTHPIGNARNRREKSIIEHFCF